MENAWLIVVFFLSFIRLPFGLTLGQALCSPYGLVGITAFPAGIGFHPGIRRFYQFHALKKIEQFIERPRIYNNNTPIKKNSIFSHFLPK